MPTSPDHFSFRLPERQSKHRHLASTFFALFSILFVAGALASGYLFIARASNLLLAAVLVTDHAGPIAPIPGSEQPHASTHVPAGGAATPIPSVESPIGADRINVLLLGVDQRPDERGEPTRSDTMIVVTIDPVGKTAGLLSIPRDLWVPIPIDDEKPILAKITTAHFFGDYYHVPGGGPALAKKTVQYNLGIRIHYYAKVNFEGFRRIVDTLGGIDLYVPTPLIDNEYPTDDYRYQQVYIPAGCQHLNGDLALKYARSRHMDSDFGRMKRQQAVLLAIRQRALRLNVIPKLPQLAMELSNAVQTDIPLPELVKIATIGSQIDFSAITIRTIEGPAVRDIVTSDGEEALLPVRSEIRKIVADVFAPAAAKPHPTATSLSSSVPASPSIVPTATPTPPSAPPTCG